MASRGKIISNQYSGQTIEFIRTARETGGQMLEMVSRYRPWSVPPPAHYHPVQAEIFTVLQGELTVRINGRNYTLRKGETIEIAPRTTHAMWNASGEETVVSWKVFPALDTELFLEKAFEDAAISDPAKKDPLKIASLLLNHHKAYRLAKPPFFLQRMIFMLLYPIALLKGKRARIAADANSEENHFTNSPKSFSTVLLDNKFATK